MRPKDEKWKKDQSNARNRTKKKKSSECQSVVAKQDFSNKSTTKKAVFLRMKCALLGFFRIMQVSNLSLGSIKHLITNIIIPQV